MILTATTVRQVAPSAWLVGGEPTAESTILMLNNSLRPVAINAGETFEIRATVQRYNDPESMSGEVGALPNMYNGAFTVYEGSFVLVSTDLTTSGA